MAKIVYARPGDNIAALVAPTVQSGAEDTTYPAAGLKDLNPAKPAKLTSTTGAWLWDFGVAKSVDLVAIIHHNLTAGLNVRIQANAANAWGAPSIDQAITIPAYQEDGFPVSPFVDLTGINPRSYRYWRLVVVAANGAPVAIGEVVLAATKRTFEINVSWGAREQEEHPIIEHRTDHGVSIIYDLGTKWRTFAGELETTDAGLSSLRSLARDARNRARPFLLIPDPDINDAWFVRLLEPNFEHEHTFINQRKLSVRFQEVSRGLPL